MNISAPSSEVHNGLRAYHGIAVLADDNQEHTWELLGDARELADRLRQRVTVIGWELSAEQGRDLIERGADDIVMARGERPTDAGTASHPWLSLAARLQAIEPWYRSANPRALFIAASSIGRTLAAQLAARCDAELFSPTLLARVHQDCLQITTLHWDGRRARQTELAAHRPAILVMHKDVAPIRRADPSRTGDIQSLSPTPAQGEAVMAARRIDADPKETDIAHLPRLIAGGYGLGGREGFELLRTIAAKLRAGVAASRLAVDSGWIERERQVGQTGKTVRPELYIACGISGATHHLEGMSQSRHVLAINTDPQAPIFRIAHLGLVADWRQTLLKLDSMLPSAQ